MKARHATDTLAMALIASGCDNAQVVQWPRLPRGYLTRAWSTSAARPVILRPRAQSSAGNRRSRTGFCSKTTSCRAISSGRSQPSSITTITAVTTRVSAISPADIDSCWSRPDRTGTKQALGMQTDACLFSAARCERAVAWRSLM